MAIPNDPILEEETISPVLAEDAIIAKDQDINGNEILNDGDDVVKVAGLGKGISKVVKPVTDFFNDSADVLVAPAVKKAKEKAKLENKKIVEQSVDENPLVVSANGELRIRNATPEETTLLSGYKDIDQPLRTNEKGTAKIKSGDKVILPNLEKITSLDGDDASLDKFLASTYLAYKDKKVDGQLILEKGNRGFKEIIKDANRIGSVDIFLKIMNRKKGDPNFTDAELLASRKTIISLQINAKKLLDKAIKTGDLLDLAKASQAISIEGYASIQLIKIQEDLGRALVTNKIISSPSSARVSAMGTMLETVDGGAGTAVINESNLAEFVEAYGGEEGLRQFLAMYNRLPTDLAKNNFAKKSIFRKAGDSLVEIFQSALLSNPLTHTFNFAGQASFQQLLIIERALGLEFAEATAMMKAQIKYMPQAFKAGWYALKHEKSMTEASTKLESNMKAISREGWGLRNTEEGGGDIENTFAFFADGFGVMMRLFGYRPMLAMDDMFKSIQRGMQLEALAVRAKKDAYSSVIETGKVPKDFVGTLEEYATQQANNAHLKTLNSQTAFDEASQFAKMATFQDDLDGMLGDPKFANFFNSPLMKIFVPFYKTPTKIVQRIMERTPLGLLMPTVIRDQLINGSPLQRKQALAKMSLASGITATTLMLSSGLISDDFIITGYGETNPKARKSWLEEHQPYSIGIKKPDGSWDWISYKRYDPISGMLAFIADTAYTMRFSDDQEMNAEAFMNLTIGSLKYVATSLPMTQFIGEFIDVAGSSYEEDGAKANRIAEILAKQVTTTGGTIFQQIATGGLGGQGVTSTIERYVSPNASNVMPENRYHHIPYIGNITQPLLRGHYEGLNRLRSRIPYFSKDLPTATNRWNEPIKQTNGGIWETVIPYRVVNKKMGIVINTELNRLGLGFNRLSKGMDEPMLKLSGKQYQRYKELYNDPMKAKTKPKVTIPPILENFKNTIEGKTYIDGKWIVLSEGSNYIKKIDLENTSKYIPTNRKDKIDMLRKIDSKYKQIAKESMFLEFPELRAIKNKRDAYHNEKGQNPPIITAPTNLELENAENENKVILESISD